MSEKFVPDKDERVTQVIVVELLSKNADTGKRIAAKLEDVMYDLAMMRDIDYMISVGSPDDMINNPNMTEFMSSKQQGYLKKLLGDIRPLIGRYKVGLDKGECLDPDVFTHAEKVMSVVFSELDAHLRSPQGTISPRRGSELIDATKTVIEDMQGELNGV